MNSLLRSICDHCEYMYLCFQTKMSVVIQMRESVVYIGIFVENCKVRI